ncbi:hypothetical protein BVX99_00740 [bacterium F16]|nr:hypothetical protein BVX99_00740 [bacterium F16]
MPYPRFNRIDVKMKPLAERTSKAHIEATAVLPNSPQRDLPAHVTATIETCADKIVSARQRGRSVILAFGAHTIKNGLGPIISQLISNNSITHLATNGAGAIHDWEFSYLGMSGEDVATYAAKGEFGNWEETGRYINLAINLGAYRGLGYGEAVGAMIAEERLDIPDTNELTAGATCLTNPEQAAAASLLLGLINKGIITPGVITLEHKWQSMSLFCSAFRRNVPFTCHPMIGHDIIYNHPVNSGGLLGIAAERDFESFAHSVSTLEGGVFLSIGSAVMAPMIFEKCLSISRNVALQSGKDIRDFHLQVVDLAASPWDWSQGEPPQDNAAYYLRYNKTFSRMGADSFNYLQADNRDFLCGLLRVLQSR